LTPRGTLEKNRFHENFSIPNNPFRGIDNDSFIRARPDVGAGDEPSVGGETSIGCTGCWTAE